MTLADKIRKAAKKLKEFSARDLSDAIEIRSYKELGIVRVTIRDFLRRGEMQRIARGRYRYIPREKRITIRQRLWDVARRMTGFSLDDLEQITGAKRETIKDFCRWMVAKGYAQRVKRGHFKIKSRLKPVVPKG